MLTRVLIYSILAVLSGSITVDAAEVIELKSGQKVQGEVLKETDRDLYVDVGVDVLRIPVDRIQTRYSAGDKPMQTEVAKEGQAQVFTAARLPVRSIKQLAEIYGEGVVLVQTPSGLGSGFIVNDRGYCVTNYHVVEQETRISCTIFHQTPTGDFEKRRIKDVKILALNPFFDLALLQIPKQDDFPFTVTYLSPDEDIKEGEEVFAIGNPLGLERSVSQGIVSTRNRNFDGVVYIQTTTEINPGNSGGPLFNIRGEVVGVTNMKLVGAEGLGFAIPIAYVKHFLRNRDAFAFDQNNPNTGFRYLEAPRRKDLSAPPVK
ncbi:MAG: S1C family serine protease [Planctomycetaceae bacterium]